MKKIIMHIDVNNAFLSWTAVEFLKNGSKEDIRFSVEDHKVENEILKTSYYELKPISAEDAKLILSERIQDKFLAFVNVDTGKVNVIFKLKDGKNFGLVEPEA